MKKLFATLALATMAIASAHALEVGVHATSDYSGASRTSGYGLSLSDKFGPIDVQADFTRFTAGADNQTRYAITGGYDVAQFGKITVTPKIGVVGLDNRLSANGYAVTVGVGASMPLTKQVSLQVDASRQFGQSRVSASDGNRLTAGLKYRF